MADSIWSSMRWAPGFGRLAHILDDLAQRCGELGRGQRQLADKLSAFEPVGLRIPLLEERLHSLEAQGAELGRQAHRLSEQLAQRAAQQASLEQRVVYLEGQLLHTFQLLEHRTDLIYRNLALALAARGIPLEPAESSPDQKDG